MSAVRVVEIRPLEDPRWEGLVGRQPSEVFQSGRWLSVLRRVYGMDVRALVVEEGPGELVAGLPFVLGEGGRMTTLPFSDHCDPITPEPEHWKLLSEAIATDQRPIAIRTLHNRAVKEDGTLEQVGRARWHGVDTGREPDRMWDALDESARRAVRKARKEGIGIRRGDDERDLRAFFELHLGVRKRKYRLLAQPYAFFTAIADAFGDDLVLLLAEHEGRAVAGILFLRHRDRLYYKFNASDSDALHLRPNDLLIWTGLQMAAEEGCALLDFGLSDWDQEGLVRYKRKFDAREGEIAFLRRDWVERAGGEEWREVLPRLTSLLTRPEVPDDVTEEAGALLYRFFA